MVLAGREAGGGVFREDMLGHLGGVILVRMETEFWGSSSGCQDTLYGN